MFRCFTCFTCFTIVNAIFVMLPRYRVEYANVMPLCLLCRYGVKMDTEISATRLYSNGTYLYVENRLSEIKWLLF